MKLLIHDFELPLRHTFTISRESHSLQETVVCELQEGGLSGFGEATTNSYYRVTSKSLRASLESQRELLDGISLRDVSPEQLWSQLSAALPEDPFALCALDQAAYDLWGKLQGKSLIELWGQTTENVPASCFTIGIDDVEVMIAKLDEMPGWPVYKIKLGTEHDVDIVRQLRERTDAKFRVDANCGWQVEEALANSVALAQLGVEFIEQPLPADDWAGHRTLFEKSALPIFADESCLVESDIERCVGHFQGVNIKLVKCGGLTPARRMITRAHELGMHVMVGCMTESTVGISAIAQLLPQLDYVDMDGATLLSRDIASGATLEKGICRFPKLAGSGVALLENQNSEED